ncbi:MAG: lysoplasmalogenase [Hyphomicrobiales bacterium]|nr:lysoplasmalogenase [Hyphomicrobiales bacterium]
MNALDLLAALSGVVSIVAFQTGPWLLAAITKATTTILIMVYAARRNSGDAYARAISLGLIASLAGDVFLLWPVQGFLPGLVSFLVAHLFYLYAFTGGLRRGLARAPSLGYAIFAVVALGFLWSDVPGALQLPVVVYVVALVAMAAMAASMALRSGAHDIAFSRMAALGAGLFVLSDTTLAFNKFAGPIPLANVVVLTTYWLAQWAIASSVRPAR